MNQLKKYHQTILYLLLLCLLWLGACSDEIQREINPPNPTTAQTDSVDVTFVLNATTTETHKGKTRVGVDDENSITDASVFVFTKNGLNEPFRFAYSISHNNVVTTSGGVIRLKTTLKQSALPVKVHIHAHDAKSGVYTPKVEGPGIYDFGATEQDMMESDGPVYAYGFEGKPLTNIPMWGEYTFPSVGSTPLTGTVKMYRAMAKFQINIAPEIASDFEHTGTYVIDHFPFLHIIPKEVDPMGKITEPNVPFNGIRPKLYTPDDDPLYYEQQLASPDAPFYLSEQNGFGTAEELAENGRTGKNYRRIIISGKYKDGPELFYNLVVKHGNIYGKVVRNHYYHITLNKITGGGLLSLGAAITSETFHLVYDALPLDMGQGMTHIAFDNIEKLSAAEKIIFIPFRVNGVPPSILETYPFTQEIPIQGTSGELSVAIITNPYSGSTTAFGKKAYLTSSILSEEGEVIEISVENNSMLKIRSLTNFPPPSHCPHYVLLPNHGFGTFILSSGSKSIELAISINRSLSSFIEGNGLNPGQLKYMELPYEGGSKTVHVTSDAPWEITSLPSWIKVNKTNHKMFKISVAEAQTNIDREGIVTFKNKAGNTDAIFVHQHRKIEWAAANSRGGDNNYFREENVEWPYPYFGTPNYYFVSSTPETQKNVTFAEPAGDVGHMMYEPKENNYETRFPLATYPGAQVHYDKARPTHSDMHGDLYWDLSKPVCPPGWRLPTLQEVRILKEQIKWSGTTLYYEQQKENGDIENIYFPACGYAWWKKLHYACFSEPSSNVSYLLSSPLMPFDQDPSKATTLTIELQRDQPVGCVRCVR